VFAQEREDDGVKIKIGVVEGQADVEPIGVERVAGQGARVAGGDVREVRLKNPAELLRRCAPRNDGI